VTVEQESLPDVIPLEACYLGWPEGLQKLTKLVERSQPVAIRHAMKQIIPTNPYYRGMRTEPKLKT
jgi:hypothetical protein